VDVFSQTLPVRFGDVDKSDTMTAAAVFDLFQEAAIQHAELLGAGRDAMLAKGQGWVLSRISVLMETRPRFGQTVTVRSWPRGPHKLFAVRDYDIRDEAGKALVRGRSGWLVIDMEKRRPLRPDQVVADMPRNDNLNAFEGAADNTAPAALAVRKDLLPAGRREARYSDIDYNGHVNNARYIQWIQDITENAVLENARRMQIDINYLAEVKPGDAVELFMAPIEGSSGAFAYEGRRSGEAAFRAELRSL
jgi:acyl-ACP thioesterase